MQKALSHRCGDGKALLYYFGQNAKQDILVATTSEKLNKIEGKFILAEQILKSIEGKMCKEHLTDFAMLGK